jgi:hypothetical protein
MAAGLWACVAILCQAFAAVTPLLEMSGHPSEPIRYVEQFKTDLC